ncbi:mycofactocin-coupled SDR family oxidoreductase [Aeromicrobium sp. P5_D10]
MRRLEGKVAVITGGGRGQGRAHAVAMAAEGADVVVCDIDAQHELVPYPMNAPDDLAETVAAVEAVGGRCIARVADVRELDAVQSVVDGAISDFGQVDILVANAGVFVGKPIVDQTAGEFAVVVDTMLTGTFNSIKAVAPHMISRGSGRVIATASGMGRHGGANMASYVAAKWGVIGLVKSAAKELGPHGITANILNPGLVDTGIIRNDHLRRLFNPELENPTDADVDQKILAFGLHHMPIAALPVEDVAAAAVFLASDEARYVSGGTLDVGAGYAANHT